MSAHNTPPTIRVEIVSAEGSLYSGHACYLTAPAQMGDVGITPGHAALLTRLRPGELCLRPPQGRTLLVYVSGGLLEVQPTVVTVLADTAIRAEDLDERVVNEARRRAEKAARQAQPGRDGMPRIDYARARAELAQAMAQYKTLQDLKRHRRKAR